MTFFGININNRLELIDPENGKVIQERIIDLSLYETLKQQMQQDFLNFQTNFNDLSR